VNKNKAKKLFSININIMSAKKSTTAKV